MPKSRPASSARQKPASRARQNLPTVDLDGRLGLSQREAATTIGKSAGCLRRWARLGLGPKFVRVGNRALVYPVSDLKSFLARNATDPADRVG